MSSISSLTHLIFDLDNTLYAPHLGVVQRVNARIDLFIREHLGLVGADVDTLRERYRREHGTTLHGLMLHHRIEPDVYLAAVHAIELDDVLAPDPMLRAMLNRLPYEKIVFTNGSAAHAARVLHRLAIRECFATVFSLDSIDYVPKPRPAAFRTVLDALGTEAEQCMFIDDDPKNLATAHALGMRTVLVGPATGHDHSAVASVHDVAGLLAS